MLDSNDHLEECIVAVSANSVSVYYTAESKSLLLPHLNFWGDITEFQVLESEVEDTSAVELFKILSFIEMVKGHRYTLTSPHNEELHVAWSLRFLPLS